MAEAAGAKFRPQPPGNARDLLPPLYGIVYEYLTRSEQWYVTTGALGAEGTTGAEGSTAATALDQFEARTAKDSPTEMDVIRDAIANDHLHIFIHARGIMSPHVTQLDNVAGMLIEYDRVDMFRQYAKNKYILKEKREAIMKHGAVKMMRMAYQRRIKQFHHYAFAAALHGHRQCLQALVKNEPEYDGAGDADVYCGAVCSDKVDVVEYVAKHWPRSLEGWAHINGARFTVEEAAGLYARSAEMAGHLLRNWRGPDRFALAKILLSTALIKDSVETLKEITKYVPISAFKILAIYETHAKDLMDKHAVYQYLKSEGVTLPDRPTQDV